MIIAFVSGPGLLQYEIILLSYICTFQLQVSLQDGLHRTIEYFREELSRTTFYNNQTYMDVNVKSPH